MRTVPLKRVAYIRVSNVDKKTVEGDVPVRLCNYTDVYYRDVIRADQEFMTATATPEQVAAFRLRAGDVLITKDSETPDDIGVPSIVEVAAPDLICGYHLALIRPNPRLVDDRYLYWSVCGDSVREQWSVAATGVTRFGLRSDTIGGAVLRWPELTEQRSISAFLDAEIGRIDELLGSKRALGRLLAERQQPAIDSAFDVDEPLVALRRLAGRITSGPRGWAEYASDTGTPFLRITNIQRDSIELDLSNTLLVDAPPSAESRRTAVRDGDVLVSITADIGSVAIARRDQAGANVSQHVALLTPVGCLPEWMAFAIRSSLARAQLDAGQYGGTKTQLSLGDIAALRVPVPNVDEQRRRLDHLTQVLSTTESARQLLTRQIALLQERRQALITAAVTGVLEIPGVAA